MKLQRSPVMHSQRGFTLVELILVIGIAGILGAISIWGAATLLPKYRLNSAASTVRNDLYRAKVLAAQRKVQYKVVFTANGYSIQEGNKSVGSDAWTPVASRDLADEYGGIDFDLGETEDAIFHPRGTAEAVTITIENTQGEIREITTTLSGRIKIKS